MTELANISVFECDDYREYLILLFGKSGGRNGLRQRACASMGCHSTYLSQVLSGKINVSLEFAETLSVFLAHDKVESDYFLLLVLMERAGTESLKKRFADQIAAILKSRNQISARMGDLQKISADNQNRFYSSWLYGALHVLVSIPRYQTAEALSAATGVNLKRVLEELKFLEKIGLIKKAGNKYLIGPKAIHLENDSQAVVKHHTNWRFHTIQNLIKREPRDLHYSAVVTLDEVAVKSIRSSLLANLESNVNSIKKAKEDVAYVYSFDFYRLS